MSYSSFYPSSARPQEQESQGVAASPEGLLASGDAGLLRRFIQLSGQVPGGDDLAKQKLLDAAHQTLVTMPDGRALRMELWAWPVTFSYKGPRRVSTSYCVTSVKSDGPAIQLRLRELWARAFAAQNGLQVAPQLTFVHMNALLGASPLQIKHVVMQGQNLMMRLPVSMSQSWGIPQDSFEASDADMPTTMLMICYVATDANAPSPKVKLDSRVRMDMDGMLRGLMSLREDEILRSMVGVPQLLSDAVTQAQGLQLCAMQTRAQLTNRQLAVSTCTDDADPMLPRYSMTAEYLSDMDEDPERVLQWHYTALWRPSTHMVDVASRLDGFVAAHQSAPPADFGASPAPGFLEPRSLH